MWKSNHTCVIESTGPDLTWQQTFYEDAVRAGADGSKIIHFGHIKEKHGPNGAVEDFEEAKRRTAYYLIPLLHPRLHENFLADVAELRTRVAGVNQISLIVFDVQGLDDVSDNHALMTKKSIQALFSHLYKKHRPRIVQRKEALDYIVSSLPSEQRQAS